MIEKRMDMGDSGKDFFIAGYVCPEKLHSHSPTIPEGASLIQVDLDTMDFANSSLIQRAGKFHSSLLYERVYDEKFLLDGAIVEIQRRLGNCPHYIGVTHETEIGVAYVVRKLELPTDGLRWPNDIESFISENRSS